MTNLKKLIFILVLTLVAAYIALPKTIKLDFFVGEWEVERQISLPQIDFYFLGRHVQPRFELKQGLDIQGGMQVILNADMSEIDEADREDALQAAKDIISRRVDMYGIAEPRIRTSKQGEQYRIIVELPGVTDQQQALQLVGQTAELEFRLEKEELNPKATQSAALFLSNYEATDLTGRDLKKAQLSFNQQTGEPVVALEFNAEGKRKFGQITQNNQGKVLAIFLDGFPIAMPYINEPILDGRAIMSGGFTVEKAENLAIQLNAGALPVPIEVLEQRTIGASLGEESVQRSIKAGLVGLILVAVFMVVYYGLKGLISSLVLLIYAVLTIAIYKVLGVTLSLPGIAGLILSIGMAVDSNILVFERMKEELRLGQSFSEAIEQGFGRAWDSIKDANLATIMTALVLINPLDFSFLNTSGLVRGFGLTLLIGVVLGLFTGVFVSRSLLKVFLPILNRFYVTQEKKKGQK
jgi:preprotein translocase subunit SecD